MVFTPERIKYLLERARIGREERGGHDRRSEADLKAFAECDEMMRREAIDPQPAPFHLKHPEKEFPRGRPPKA